MHSCCSRPTPTSTWMRCGRRPKHHYYAKHSHIPEQLAEEDKETAEVKRSDINAVAPIPKDPPMTVSKNMRARGGGNKQRGGGGAGGAGLGRRGGVADGGGEEMGDGVDVADDDKDDGAAVKDEDDAAKARTTIKQGKFVMRTMTDPKPASGASLREQEMAYWKKHDEPARKDKENSYDSPITKVSLATTYT